MSLTSQEYAIRPACLRRQHAARSERRDAAIAPNLIQRIAGSFVTGTFCVARAVAVCFYTCYVFCPPIPAICTNKIAFHPPTNQHYHFIVKDEKGKETRIKNLKQIIKQPAENTIVQIVLELSLHHTQQITPVDDVYPFVTTTSRNNIIAGICIPCRLDKRPKVFERSVVIFCQPNSSNLSTFLWGMHGFSFREMSDKIGVDIYGFDYSGFGISTGSPSEANIYADIQATYDYVKRERPDCKIYLMGTSLGTSAVIDLASKRPENLGGVVLLAPFTSGLGVMCGVKDKSFKFDAFKSIDKISAVDVPVFIAHGLQDDIIPFQHSVVLAKNVRRPVPIELIRNADHMSILDTHSSRILHFILSDAPEYDSLYTRDSVLEILEKRLKKIFKSRSALKTRREDQPPTSKLASRSHQCYTTWNSQTVKQHKQPIVVPFYITSSPPAPILDKFIDIKPEIFLSVNKTQSEYSLEITQKSDK